MNELELEAAVARLIDELPTLLMWHHCMDGRRCRGTPGLPDLVIVGPRGTLFRELKSPVGRATAEQYNWLHALITAGQNAGIWRPEDLHCGLIRQQLQAIA